MERTLGTKEKLIRVSKEAALIPFHGYLDGNDSNIEPLIRFFPKWNIKDADRCWCAAFVYYCCVKSGFDFPYSPNGCTSCSLAGCGGWEEFAITNDNIEYIKKSDNSFTIQPGDIVIYDYVFCNKEHDHIGVVLEVLKDKIIRARKKRQRLKSRSFNSCAI